MNVRMKTILAAAAVSLGLAAAPASAQVAGFNRGLGYTDRAIGYNDDGTLNVFGAHLDPRGSRTGLVGGVGNAVGGVVGGVGSVVGGVTGAADDVVTGSLGTRRSDYSARTGYGEQFDRPAVQYGRADSGPVESY